MKVSFDSFYSLDIFQNVGQIYEHARPTNSVRKYIITQVSNLEQ